MNSPLNDSKKRQAQNESRNAIYDKEHGYKSEAKYEAKEAVKTAAMNMNSPVNNQNKGYGEMSPSNMNESALPKSGTFVTRHNPVSHALRSGIMMSGDLREQVLNRDMAPGAKDSYIKSGEGDKNY
jgi:hypothetical protein